MKKPLSVLLSAIVILSLFSFSTFAQNKSAKTKKSTKAVVIAPAAQSEWPAMDTFQQLLKSVYTPAQSGDLNPLRKNSEELSRLSILMAKSEYPAINDNVEMRTIVGEFTDRCEELNRSVGAAKTDEELSSELTRLNNSFSEILNMRQTQKTEK